MTRRRAPARAPDELPPARRGRAMLVLAADPRQPNRTIWRVQIVAVHDRLWRCGLLTDAEREAGDRLAAAVETLTRLSIPLGAADGGGAQRATRSVPEAAMRAAQSIREAAAELGAAEAEWACRVCAVGDWPAPPAEAERAADATVRLVRALHTLAARWRMA